MNREPALPTGPIVVDKEWEDPVETQDEPKEEVLEEITKDKDEDIRTDLDPETRMRDALLHPLRPPPGFHEDSQGVSRSEKVRQLLELVGNSCCGD